MLSGTPKTSQRTSEMTDGTSKKAPGTPEIVPGNSNSHPGTSNESQRLPDAAQDNLKTGKRRINDIKSSVPAASRLQKSYENNRDFINPHLHKRYLTATSSTPKPYLVLRRKLIDEASLKYFVGQVISPIS